MRKCQNFKFFPRNLNEQDIDVPIIRNDMRKTSKQHEIDDFKNQQDIDSNSQSFRNELIFGILSPRKRSRPFAHLSEAIN